jgi:PhnB protein
MKSTSIQPWLTVYNVEHAVIFYTSAFDAEEVYRLDLPEGPVVQLSAGDAKFWLSSGSNTDEHLSLQANNIRMILVVENVEDTYNKAINAGGKPIYPVAEEHGWITGRIEDPFGMHWEISKQTT